MDSRLKKISIAVCVTLILLLITAVFVFNYITNGWKLSKTTQEDTAPVVVEQPPLSEEELKAFLKDESFFDEEPVESETVDAQNYTRVTLYCNSVYRDIRIQIRNSESELEKGQLFQVEIPGLGKFADDNQDGVILIDRVEPGTYEVSLEELEGYRVPVAAMKVQVSEVVSFDYITDIGLFMHTTDEINEDAEDSSEHNVDMDDTERMDELALDDGVNFGIEISSWNQDIDWTKVQAAGVDFVILRCGYRGMTTGVLVEDAKFRQNIEDALAVGMHVAVYFRSQAITELEAVEEASMVVKLCREYAVTYPVFIESTSAFGSDDKSSRTDALTAEDRTAIIAAFCETMENSGYRTGVMATTSWMEKELKMASLKKFYVYLEEYREKPKYAGEYAFWKYSDKGWIDGITGRVGVVTGFYEY